MKSQIHNPKSKITLLTSLFVLLTSVFSAPAFAGSIVVWGDNTYGECNMPLPNTGFIAIAAGRWHSLGLKQDGSTVGCGYNVRGQCNIPEPNTGFVAVAAGAFHSLGLKSDGSIVGWGDNVYGECNIPEPNTGFVAVAAGGFHSLGLKSDGSIVAWGKVLWGGNDGSECNIPSPNTGFVAISAGFNHSLGLKSDGSIVAWGSNYDWYGHYQGQCNIPEPNTDFVAVAAGQWHSLGLKNNGSIVAWGSDGYSFPGDPYVHTGQCDIPLPNTDFIGIAGGSWHSLGLKNDGSIVAWGAGPPHDYGQCTIPSPNTGFVAVAAGCVHSLGLVQAGFEPVVSNVAASQRSDGSKLVDISYGLYDADGDKCRVLIEVSSDGGTTWTVPTTSTTGDIGPDIIPDSNRHIVWDPKVDAPGQTGCNFKVRITADDNNGGTHHAESELFCLQTGELPDIRPNGSLQLSYWGRPWWGLLGDTYAIEIENPGPHFVYIPEKNYQGQPNITIGGISLKDNSDITISEVLESSLPRRLILTAERIYEDHSTEIALIDLILNPPTTPLKVIQCVAPVIVPKEILPPHIDIDPKGIFIHLVADAFGRDSDKLGATDWFTNMFVYGTPYSDFCSYYGGYVSPLTCLSSHAYDDVCFYHESLGALNKGCDLYEMYCYYKGPKDNFTNYAYKYNLPKTYQKGFIMPPETMVRLEIPCNLVDTKGITVSIIEYQALKTTYPDSDKLFSMLYTMGYIFKGGDLLHSGTEFEYHNFAAYIKEPFGHNMLTQKAVILPLEETTLDKLIDSSVHQAKFEIVWAGSELDLRLVTPNNVTIDPEYATLNNIPHGKTQTSEFYTISNLQSGNWSMIVCAIDVPAEGEEFSASVFMDTDTVLLLNTNSQNYNKDENIVLQAAAVHDMNALTNITINAFVREPNCPAIITLALYDDGSHNDQQNNDGIYGNTYPASVKGTYVIKAVATGLNSRSEPFQRETTKQISVESFPDFVVDLQYLAIMADNWLGICSAPAWCDGCDINESSFVDFVDFAQLAENWLWQAQP